MAEETFVFQSDINELMSLIIHAFYSNKDIFLRELLSNASDALDKIRYQSLTDTSVLGNKTELDIHIVQDVANGTLTIQDSGIGMTKEELKKNLGTIAHSGTKAFMQKMNEGGSKNDALSLIGQFGVGFYAAYLVADRVQVISKSNDDEQYIWESCAGGTFTITQDVGGEALGRGTKIVLHLKEDGKKYLAEGLLKDIVKKHSEFITYPIYLEVEREVEVEEGDEVDTLANDDGGGDKEDVEGHVEDVSTKSEDAVDASNDNAPLKKKVMQKQWELLNSQKPLWLRKQNEVSKEDYAGFFKGVFNEWADPLAHKHFNVEGQLDFTGLLFIPRMAPFDMFEPNKKWKNIKLYVKRVFITDDCTEFFPEYLSFVKGIVDSEDLPLNISREMFQENKVFNVIKKNVVKKIIEMMNDLAENEEDYKQFYEQFGRNLKWGVHSDDANRNKLLPLLRFYTSKSEDKMVTLKEYVDRMKAGQKHIYYITGESVDAVKELPFMEILRKKDYEVIYMVDTIDEYMMFSLKEFDGKKLKCICKENADILDDEAEKKKLEDENAKYKDLCKRIKDEIGADRIMKVQVSSLLVNTPCILVSPEYGWTSSMEKIMKAQALKANQAFPTHNVKKIVEINPDHPLIKELLKLSEEEEDSNRFKNLVHFIYDTALIGSGFGLDNPASFANKIYEVMTGSLLCSETKDQIEHT
jgi:molecular chaperone HtpG